MFSFVPDAVWAAIMNVVVVVAASGPVIHTASGTGLFNVAGVVVVIYFYKIMIIFTLAKPKLIASFN